jgi:hypothetical protein
MVAAVTNKPALRYGADKKFVSYPVRAVVMAF